MDTSVIIRGIIRPQSERVYYSPQSVERNIHTGVVWLLEMSFTCMLGSFTSTVQDERAVCRIQILPHKIMRALSRLNSTGAIKRSPFTITAL